MSDLISRQAAINALRADPMGGLNYESILGRLPSAQPEIIRCKDCKHYLVGANTGCWYVMYQNGENDFCSRAEIFAVEQKGEPMSDLIDRQAAIDTLADMHCKSDEDGYVWIIRSDAWARIDALPSAQPEIIRCKDCEYYCTKRASWRCKRYGLPRSPEDFCSMAERRTDE